MITSISVISCNISFLISDFINLSLLSFHFSDPPDTPFLLSVFFHTDTDTMYILWMLLIYCYLLCLGICGSFLSTGFVAKVVLFSYLVDCSFYVQILYKSILLYCINVN